MKFLFALLSLTATSFSYGQGTPEEAIVSGNAMISPASVTKITKALIVSSLQKNYNAESKLYGLTVQTGATQHSLEIPQGELLKQILSTLGVSGQVGIQLSPIETSVGFDPQTFKLSVKKTAVNTFSLTAHWELNHLSAKCSSLNIQVPKGAFDRDFTIASKPVTISMKKKMGAITADLYMTAKLGAEGATISLNGFKTNLDDSTPRLSVKLGKLTVDDQPLELEIISNGQSLLTTEDAIRTQFQKFEPQLVSKIQKELGKIIQSEFTEASKALENEEPFKLSVKSDELLNRFDLRDPNIRDLAKNIHADFMFSYIQEIPQQNLLAAQVASQVCIDQKCLNNEYQTSSISTLDTSSMAGKDVGVIVYESWIKNLINSEEFQSRIRSYYKKNLKSPGVNLGADGFKVHFSPPRNALVAVLNLKIDIKATMEAGSAFDSWSKFGEYLKKQFADIWENIAGSGQYVFVPVEIVFKLKGVQIDRYGKRVIVIETDIPMDRSGTILNTYGYRSNVQHMNATIRKELLSSVKTEIDLSIPDMIHIDVNDTIDYAGTRFSIDDLKITKNKGLLVSGSVK